MISDTIIIEQLKCEDTDQKILDYALRESVPSGVFQPHAAPDWQSCNRQQLEELLATLRRAHHIVTLTHSEHQGDSLIERYKVTKRGGCLELRWEEDSSFPDRYSKLYMSYDTGCGVTWGLRYTIRTKELSAHLKRLREGCAIWAKELPMLTQRIIDLRQQVEAGASAIRTFCDTLCADTNKSYDVNVEYDLWGYDATLYLRFDSSQWLAVELRSEEPVAQLGGLRHKLDRAVAALSRLSAIDLDLKHYVS